MNNDFEIGYINDDRHFIDIELSLDEIKPVCPSKEKIELILVSEQIKSEKLNATNFIVKEVYILSFKHESLAVYVIQDKVSKRVFGAYVEQHNVHVFNVNGYQKTNPKKSDLECISIKQAMKKSGMKNY